LDILAAKHRRMAREVATVPAVAQQQRLPRVGIGNLQDQTPAIEEQVSDELQGFHRIMLMLQYMDCGNDRERSLVKASFPESREDAVLVTSLSCGRSGTRIRLDGSDRQTPPTQQIRQPSRSTEFEHRAIEMPASFNKSNLAASTESAAKTANSAAERWLALPPVSNGPRRIRPCRNRSPVERDRPATDAFGSNEYPVSFFQQAILALEKLPERIALAPRAGGHAIEPSAVWWPIRVWHRQEAAAGVLPEALDSPNQLRRASKQTPSDGGKF